MKKPIVLSALLLGALLAPIAHAQLQLPGEVTNVSNISNIQNFICTFIFSWLFTAAVLLVIFFVLMAAYRYMTAGDNADQIQTANKTLIYAAIGLAIAILARTVPIMIGALVTNNGVRLDPCVSGSTIVPGGTNTGGGTNTPGGPTNRPPGT